MPQPRSVYSVVAPPARSNEPGRSGWRRFVVLLFIYMTFEGILRRSLPFYNLEILLFKDAALAVFYGYFLLCIYPSMPKWPRRDKILIFLAILFAAVNLLGIVRAGQAAWLPVIIGLKANFWYVPLFFIGRRYFTSFRQMRQFWRRLAWLLIPVAAVAIWQVLFGQFNAYAIPTATVDAENWAAAGAGSLRNNVDGTQIATVSSTFFGARLAAFAALWVPIMIVLCMTDQKRTAIFRMPYVYVALACSLVGLFLSANRTAAALSIISAALLLLVARGHNSFRFLVRIGGIALVVILSAGIYRVSSTTDMVADRVNAFTSFLSGLMDAPASDVQTSRYAVVGPEVVRGIQLATSEVGPLGRGVGVLTQGAIYINGDLQSTFEVQRARDAQADSQWVRLVIELGIPGLVLFLAIALRVMGRAAMETWRAHQKSWTDGLTAALAPLFLLLYLGLSHKHAGFAVDPMFQCYVYFTLGAVFGIAARKNGRLTARV